MKRIVRSHPRGSLWAGYQIMIRRLQLSVIIQVETRMLFENWRYSILACVPCYLSSAIVILGQVYFLGVMETIVQLLSASNPALGTQGIVTVWMLTPHYDAPQCSPMLTFATKKLSTVQKDKRQKPNSPFVRAFSIELSSGNDDFGVSVTPGP